jgi:hypothetical protein
MRFMKLGVYHPFALYITLANVELECHGERRCTTKYTNASSNMTNHSFSLSIVEPKSTGF